MNSLIAGLVAVIGALGGFYFGAKYGQGHPAPSNTPAAAVSSPGTGQGAATGGGAKAGGGGLAGGAGGAAGLGAAAAGPIIAVNGSIITVHDRQTDKDVKVNVAAARITKTDQGTINDLTQNQTVTVIGQAGADGTVSAQAITIGGGGATGFGGGGRQGRPSPSPS
jgi:hypothetical protein